MTTGSLRPAHAPSPITPPAAPLPPRLAPAAESALRAAAALALEASVQAVDLAWEEHVTAQGDPSVEGARERSHQFHAIGEWFCGLYRGYRLAYDPDWREREPVPTPAPLRARAARWISGPGPRRMRR